MIDLTNIEFYKNVSWKEEKINNKKNLFPEEWKIDILENICNITKGK